FCGGFWRSTIPGVNRPTRTLSVQDRIISETHSSLLQRGGRGEGAAAPFPCTPNPRRPSSASLRTTSPGPSRLTKPNTSCTIITPASLRSDCCSPSLRNAVRLASGIDVHLHWNTHDQPRDVLPPRRGMMMARILPEKSESSFAPRDSFYSCATF